MIREILIKIRLATRKVFLAGSGDFSAQFIFEMDADDFLERAFGFEPERRRPLRLQPCSPAIDDLDDRRIWLAANTGNNLVARDLPQRLDLLADRH